MLRRSESTITMALTLSSRATSNRARTAVPLPLMPWYVKLMRCSLWRGLVRMIFSM
jgi:hypothetical protein